MGISINKVTFSLIKKAKRIIRKTDKKKCTEKRLRLVFLYAPY